jgi:lipid-A-disaccharide synthase
MFTIFPFETEFYTRYNFNVHYVGNPLMDSIAEFRANAQPKTDFLKNNKFDDRPIIALLAGSRVQEIKRTLPLMTKVAVLFPDFQFVVAGVKSVGSELYNSQLEGSGLQLIYDQTYDLLNNAHAALVASGTAALETALFKVPQTVIYKVEGGLLMDVIMRNFVIKTVGVALPNIIMNKEFVVELIQKKMTLRNVENEMKKLLFDKQYRSVMVSEYNRLEKILGGLGCSERAAKKMVSLLKDSN